jgi:hypothetical protein
MAGRNFEGFVNREAGGRHLHASEVVSEALGRYQAALPKDNARVPAIGIAVQEGREDIAGGTTRW